MDVGGAVSGCMPRRRNERVFATSENPVRAQGGRARVARRFLPALPAAALIRLPSDDARRALSRRRLARLIDPGSGVS